MKVLCRSTAGCSISGCIMLTRESASFRMSRACRVPSPRMNGRQRARDTLRKKKCARPSKRQLTRLTQSRRTPKLSRNLGQVDRGAGIVRCAQASAKSGVLRQCCRSAALAVVLSAVALHLARLWTESRSSLFPATEKGLVQVCVKTLAILLPGNPSP